MSDRSRINDVFRGDETMAELLDRGLTEQDADEIRAFSEFLRRAGGCGRPDIVAPDPATLRYARGEITGAEYLDAVQPKGEPA
jgi:hypothetical protein